MVWLLWLAERDRDGGSDRDRDGLLQQIEAVHVQCWDARGFGFSWVGIDAASIVERSLADDAHGLGMRLLGLAFTMDPLLSRLGI